MAEEEELYSNDLSQDFARARNMSPHISRYEAELFFSGEREADFA
jgi:hypothetical protein